MSTRSIEDDIYEFGFHIIDNFLAPKDFHALRTTAESMHKIGQFKSAKIGRQLQAIQNFNIRSDEICWLDESHNSPAINSYFTKVNSIASQLNRALYLGLVDFETHFAIYQQGSFYKKHIDQFATTQDRRISCVYYLNEIWEESFAGQLRLYDRQDQFLTSILPLGNRFICFTSDLPHEVCETMKTRYSIAGWMKARPII